MDIRYYATLIANSLNDLVFYSINLFGTQVPLIVMWLLFAAIFFTIYFRFINITGFVQSLRLVRGDYDSPAHKEHGEVSHFQALATALSGTVGIGNIGGVAVAISLGGPGATFWLILAGFLGMTTKFTECTLGVKYREEHADGSVSGGPMYYLKHGLKEKGMPNTAKYLSTLYAVCLVIGCFGIGNMFQSNQAFKQFYDVFLVDSISFKLAAFYFGVVLATLTGFVIVGGIKSISRVTEKVVPFMAIFYITCALYIIVQNYSNIPHVFYLIVSKAFSPDGIQGGLIGVAIIGFRRALFSNEAGIGSAAIAHSSVKTDQPVTEGYVALLEPFIDTVVICTLTSLVILLTVYDPSFTSHEPNGIQLTSSAFSSVSSLGPYFLAIATILFALSTLLAWSYYGLKAWTFLFGEGKTRENIFNIIFCCFIVIGCMVKLKNVVIISDAMIFLMAIPNIIGLYILAPIVKDELLNYKKDLASGKITNYRKIREAKASKIALRVNSRQV